jgi:hypothetical protein
MHSTQETRSIRPLPVVAFLGLALVLPLVASCGGSDDNDPVVATPSFSASRDRATLGSPLEITYRFTVSPSAPPFANNYRVLVHFLNADEELMWTDDHEPPVPTTDWKPGQVVEYKRTMFIPVYPYVGLASVRMGLYSAQGRLKLDGEDDGQRSYRVAQLQLLDQTGNVYLILKDGWHPAELAENNSAVEWQWTTKEATIAFRNPRRNGTFFLHADNPGGAFKETQTVALRAGEQVLDTFTLAPGQDAVRRTRITTDILGTGDMVELKLQVDKTFVPSIVSSTSRDPRELGIRVFHLFFEPEQDSTGS